MSLLSSLSHELSLVDEKVLVNGRNAISAEIEGLVQVRGLLGAPFVKAVRMILGIRGRVIISGMGKSGHIAHKLAATFSSTGTPAFYVHPGEASHGDMGMIATEDLCILISNSGETAELADIIAFTRRYGIGLIAITQRIESTLGRQADLVLVLPQVPEACAIGKAPTTSTTCSLALGDALAVAVMRERRFEEPDFLRLHPGGNLGSQLLPVGRIMHSGEDLPTVAADRPMGEVLVEMTAKGFGVALIIDNDRRLIGIVTDGDLRRNLDGLLDRTAIEIATRRPKTLAPEALVETALHRMKEEGVNAFPVVEDGCFLMGLVTMHDCLRVGAL